MYISATTQVLSTQLAAGGGRLSSLPRLHGEPNHTPGWIVVLDLGPIFAASLRPVCRTGDRYGNGSAGLVAQSA